MKKIVLTQRIVLNESYPEIREALDIRWAKLLKEIGCLPIILPCEVDFRDYFETCSIDGIILTGGNNLYSLSDDPLSKKRDTFEKELITYAIQNKIPLLGICRGMQIIAEYFGSSLQKISGHVGTRHLLIPREDSLFYPYLKNITEVNSYHNYAIEFISDELSISAVDEVGCIKAVEHRSHRIFAQMWHSEREIPFQKNEIDLWKIFFGV